jgi:uncharacterized protein (DUF433 family)
MANKKLERAEVASWAAATNAGTDELRTAWEDLQRRELLSKVRGKITVSPLAMRRASSDVQRRLASHLSGYLPTENSLIVRRDGNPPGVPTILNTRISVEHIAGYFKEGWGVLDLENDLEVLTREEIEAKALHSLVEVARKASGVTERGTPPRTRRTAG